MKRHSLQSLEKRKERKKEKRGRGPHGVPCNAVWRLCVSVRFCCFCSCFLGPREDYWPTPSRTA